ncbi:transporter, drug/metabolite exporter family [Bifidobacterium margollesii]|uniref:Transporter, drug/metabolite exporter family n=1 Tax=Bifidobacterium margollesii TaxID=2020964 RepID=A0A2N5J8F5_9BIFI|nr:DMT family transporter [Bifidobacterium margollesii]PLS30496.1 transporter, drug/metabolite exporter family [Bifidobacterium margollesii]
MAALVLTAMIWGFAFVSQVSGMNSMSPFFFNATRFTLGTISLIPILLVRSKRPETAAGNTASHGSPRHTILIAMLCGVVLFTASTLQQYGILYGKSAGRAGFLTALYIVIVPLLAFVFLRRRIGVLTVAAVAIAVAGFYLLCITDGFGSMTMADGLLVASALLFAVHILVIDELGSSIDPIVLSFGQFLTTTIISWICSLATGAVDWAGAGQAWIAVLYAGIGSVGIAYTLQVVGQQWVPPTRASLIMSLESFFSVIGGALLLGEIMTPRAYLGCALIFLGTLLAQAPAKLPAFLRPTTSPSDGRSSRYR